CEGSLYGKELQCSVCKEQIIFSKPMNMTPSKVHRRSLSWTRSLVTDDGETKSEKVVITNIHAPFDLVARLVAKVFCAVLVVSLIVSLIAYTVRLICEWLASGHT